MGIKRYIGFSVLLILIVGLYVYSVQNGEYSIQFLSFSLSLPIAIWILAPLILLFILTLLHLIFYSLLNYSRNRNYIKDEISIIETIKFLLLQEEDKKRFKTKPYKNLVSILKQLKLDVKDNTFTSIYEDLNTLVSQIKDIKTGKYVNEKAIKLDANSSLAKQNLINKINEQVDYALDVLKKADQFSHEIVKIAYMNVLENKSMTTIKKVYEKVKLDKKMALKLFLKDIDNKEFRLSKEEILKITKNLDYSKEEYLTLARLYKKALSPDDLIELFETLSQNVEVATSAFFYVLLELEMIEKLKGLLSSCATEEYLVFRAILDLKDTGKHYSLDDIAYN